MDIQSFFQDTQRKLNSIERRLNNFTAAGGQANTASNIGVAGVGPYQQKVGVDLQFRNINAASARISVVLDAGNNEIDLDVVEGQIDHNNLTNLQGGQANQYYHLTATEHGYVSGVNAQSVLTTASPLFVVVRLIDTGADHYLQLRCNEDLTNNRNINFVVNDVSRIITLTGNPTLADWFDQNVKQAASPQFAALTVSGNLTVDTNTLFVNSATNRIGIGTTTPAGILDIRQQGTILAQVATCASSGAAWHSARITWKRARNTLAAPQTIVANDIIGLFSFQGYDGSGYIECGIIQAACQINPTDIGDIVPTRMLFKTMDAAGAMNENLRIRHDRGIMMQGLKSGATKAAAGAITDELWVTNGHATLPDWVVMIGS